MKPLYIVEWKQVARKAMRDIEVYDTKKKALWEAKHCTFSNEQVRVFKVTAIEEIKP